MKKSKRTDFNKASILDVAYAFLYVTVFATVLILTVYAISNLKEKSAEDTVRYSYSGDNV